MSVVTQENENKKEKVKFLPYGRQDITDQDIAVVTELLRSDWLTCGPAGPAFEAALNKVVGSGEAIACANGTAALHLAMMALGIGPGDVVITSPISFLASANCARFVGAEVWFADVDPETGLMSIESLAELFKKDIEKKIKAVIPVHLAGQATDMATIAKLAKEHGCAVVEDGCHALGGSYDFDNETVKIGSCYHSDMTVFSFHPVKHVAMGEGGAVTTNDEKLAKRLRQCRSHGMTKDNLKNRDFAFDSSGEANPWYYEMPELGYNYRLSDIQAALGKSQLSRIGQSVDRRNEIAKLYDRLIAEQFDRKVVRPLTQNHNGRNAYHLYVLQVDFEKLGRSRSEVMNRLKAEGVGTQVHYIPIFAQPYYQELYGDLTAQFPHSMNYYDAALSIPMFPGLTDSDCNQIIDKLKLALYS